MAEENDHLLLERIAQLLRELLDKKLLETKLEESAPGKKKLLYTRKEAAELLSISVGSLQILISRGDIRVRRFGNRHLIPHEELERFAKKDTGQIWPEKGPQGTTRRRIA